MRIVCILIILLSPTACKYEGTEGGNPEFSSGTPIKGIVSDMIAVDICLKRDLCLGITSNNCFIQSLDQENMTQELGVSSHYKSFRDLRIAEANEDVMVMEIEYASCSDAVRQVSCRDPLPSEAFELNDYSNLHLILRQSPSCKEIFKIK